jgi:hypothetical protein
MTHYDVRGHRLWVEQEGTGDPVMLLAGFGPAGSHLIFHPQVSALAGQYRVIYCDLFGQAPLSLRFSLRMLSDRGSLVYPKGLDACRDPR